MVELICLRDLPGVAELEAALHVPGRQIDKQYDDLEDRIQALSRQLFGIDQDDTTFHPREDEIVAGVLVGDNEVLTPAGVDRYDEWEAHFAFLEWEWDEEDAFWAVGGLDVRGDDGELLEILDRFDRQIVCAIKGLHPRARIPGMHSPVQEMTEEAIRDDAERWGQRLAADAAKFKRKP